jgi:hypothetical protein
VNGKKQRKNQRVADVSVHYDSCPSPHQERNGESVE